MTFFVGDRVRARFMLVPEHHGEVIDPNVIRDGAHYVLVLWDDGVTSAAQADRLEPLGE